MTEDHLLDIPEANKDLFRHNTVTKLVLHRYYLTSTILGCLLIPVVKL